MNYLLDTNILIGALNGKRDSIPEEVIALIDDEKNGIFFSIASVWEVAIKHIKNSSLMPVSPENLVKICNKIGFNLLSLTCDQIFTLKKLRLADGAPDHKDPFDRILMAQAKHEKMTLITTDSTLRWYNEKNIMIVEKG